LGRSLTGAVSIKARAVAVDDLDLRMSNTGKTQGSRRYQAGCPR
jgi:hypothetical protein